MACPNCGDERVEYAKSGEYCYFWRLSLGVSYRADVFTCYIKYCPFCGEQLLMPSEACARGCD